MLVGPDDLQGWKGLVPVVPEPKTEEVFVPALMDRLEDTPIPLKQVVVPLIRFQSGCRCSSTQLVDNVMRDLLVQAKHHGLRLTVGSEDADRVRPAWSTGFREDVGYLKAVLVDVGKEATLSVLGRFGLWE